MSKNMYLCSLVAVLGLLIKSCGGGGGGDGGDLPIPDVGSSDGTAGNLPEYATRVLGGELEGAQVVTYGVLSIGDGSQGFRLKGKDKDKDTDTDPVDGGADGTGAQTLLMDGDVSFIEGEEDLGCFDLEFEDTAENELSGWLVIGTTGLISGDVVVPLILESGKNSIEIQGWDNAYILKEYDPGDNKSFSKELCFSVDQDAIEGITSASGDIVVQYVTGSADAQSEGDGGK